MTDQKLEKHIEEIKGLLVALLIVGIGLGVLAFWILWVLMLNL